MHCPSCDMYSQDPVTCSHCGAKIPEPVFSKQTVRQAGAGGSRMPVFIILILVAAAAVAWWMMAGGGGPIPAYMNEGPVVLSDRIIPGQTNIVDLYSEYCPPCRQIAPYLKKLDAARADINVVKVDINRPEVKGIDWQGPVARQFKLRSIPHFILISPEGKVIAEGKSAYKQVVKMIEETLN